MPERINRFHHIAKELCDLARRDSHHQGMLAVRGDRQVVLKIGTASRERVLRLLHTLFAAIEKQGHEVRLTKQSDGSSWRGERWSLQVVIDGASIEMSLREHLDRKEHEKTEIEKRYTWMGRKYDLEPSGNLILELHIPWSNDTRTRWRDGEKGRLEGLLAEVAWAVDEAARGLVIHRVQVAEQARLAEIARQEAEVRERERQQKAAEDRKRREREARDAAHQKALHEDVVRMAHAWQQAALVRSFLSAVARSIPEPERTPDLNNWLAWATAHAESLDPLQAPDEIAKPLAATT